MSTRKKSLFALLLGSLLLSCAACTPRSEPTPAVGTAISPEANTNLVNTTWRLISFSDTSGETLVTTGSKITLELTAEGRAGGTGGCNTYGARYEVQGNSLSFGQVTSTLRACKQEGLGEQEQRYLRALETAVRFELTGEHLKIWYEDGRSALDFVEG